MKKNSLTLATAGFLAALLFSCDSNTSKKVNQDSGTVEVSADTVNIPEFMGRLYTSGLSKAEAEKLGLPWPVYQLSGAESYFISGHDSLKSYIGQCIGIGGVETVWPPDTEMINEQFTYNRGHLDFATVIILENEDCSGLKPSGEAQLLDTSLLKNYRGTIGRMERPAPDIAYDYVLRPEAPLHDEHNPVHPGKRLEELPIFLMKEQEIKNLEKAIGSGQSVTLRGALVQGYAESRTLQVVEVKQ